MSAIVIGLSIGVIAAHLINWLEHSFPSRPPYHHRPGPPAPRREFDSSKWTGRQP